MDKKFDPLANEGEKAMKVVSVLCVCERGKEEGYIVCTFMFLQCSDDPFRTSTLGRVNISTSLSHSSRTLVVVVDTSPSIDATDWS